MAGVKLLLAGVSGQGKTTALGTLDPKTSLVINIDGKTFGFPIPHTNIGAFANVAELIRVIEDKVVAFKEATGEFPENIAVDTISRIYNIILDNSERLFTGFDVYKNVGKEVNAFNHFIQVMTENGINVIITTHVTFDDSQGWTDASVGNTKKLGGVLSVFDHTAFFNVEKGKYMVHHRSPTLPCRTLISKDKLPSKQRADDYSLPEHIKLITGTHAEVAKFVI